MALSSSANTTTSITTTTPIYVEEESESVPRATIKTIVNRDASTSTATIATSAANFEQFQTTISDFSQECLSQYLKLLNNPFFIVSKVKGTTYFYGGQVTYHINKNDAIQCVRFFFFQPDANIVTSSSSSSLHLSSSFSSTIVNSKNCKLSSRILNKFISDEADTDRGEESCSIEHCSTLQQIQCVPCDHKFCGRCIQGVQANNNRKGRLGCPMCRTNVESIVWIKGPRGTIPNFQEIPPITM